MKTWMQKGEENQPKWWIVDANGLTLGRMATQIAQILRGRHRPQYTPNTDCGDFVVVVNSEKVELTGQKWTTKTYYRHSRYFGSLKATTADEMRQTNPEKVIRKAVQGMLPTNKLSRRLINKLKAYKGPTHPHSSQRPQALDLGKGKN